jgi:cell division protein FtsB
MREYKQKKKIKKRIFSKVSVVILLILFVLLVRATWSVYIKSAESAANLARVNKSLTEAEKRQVALKKETERLKTEQGIEKEIRHKFQVSKEGEKVIVIVNDNKASIPTSTKPTFLNKLKGAIIDFIR